MLRGLLRKNLFTEKTSAGEKLPLVEMLHSCTPATNEKHFDLPPTRGWDHKGLSCNYSIWHWSQLQSCSQNHTLWAIKEH